MVLFMTPYFGKGIVTLQIHLLNNSNKHYLKFKFWEKQTGKAFSSFQLLLPYSHALTDSEQFNKSLEGLIYLIKTSLNMFSQFSIILFPCFIFSQTILSTWISSLILNYLNLLVNYPVKPLSVSVIKRTEGSSHSVYDSHISDSQMEGLCSVPHLSNVALLGQIKAVTWHSQLSFLHVSFSVL